MAAGLISMGPMQWTNGAQLATQNLALAGDMAKSMDKKIDRTETVTKESAGGSGVGAALGSLAGGLAGSFIPGVGTAVGSMIGSTLGGTIGGAIDGGGAGAASGALMGLGTGIKGAGGFGSATSALHDLFSNSGVEAAAKTAAGTASDSDGLYNFAKNMSTGDSMKFKYDPSGLFKS